MSEGDHFEQRRQQILRPRGRNVPDLFKQEQSQGRRKRLMEEISKEQFMLGSDPMGPNYAFGRF